MAMDQPGCAATGDQPNRRQYGRVKCEIVRCSVGTVVDASAGGLRIMIQERLPIKPGMHMELDLQARGNPIRVDVEVAWVKRKGLFKREIGVHFLEVSPELRKALCEIAHSVTTNLSFVATGSERQAM